MIQRSLLLAGLMALLVLLCGSVSSQAAPLVPQTWISGGELAGRVRLSAVDEDDFMRRINLPPLLDDEPSLSGPAYTIESPYWDEAVRGKDREESDAPEVELAAQYYPQGGFVRATQDGEDVWLVIDLRQRAILDRYIRLNKAGLIGEQPGPLEVLVAAVAAGETLSVQIGTRELDEEQTAAFWPTVADLQAFERDDVGDWQPASSPGSVWVIFNLPEGRTEQMLYVVANGEIYDRLGATSYVVPFLWLEPVLGDDAPRPGQPIDFADDQIEQQKSTGSPLWWPVMIGGGLVCLGAAVWLRRPWAWRRAARDDSDSET